MTRSRTIALLAALLPLSAAAQGICDARAEGRRLMDERMACTRGVSP